MHTLLLNYDNKKLLVIVHIRAMHILHIDKTLRQACLSVCMFAQVRKCAFVQVYVSLSKKSVAFHILSCT